MLYIATHILNPHVQKVQNMYSKFISLYYLALKAELGTAEVDPYFERKKSPLAV